jgi:hypothetical protein
LLLHFIQPHILFRHETQVNLQFSHDDDWKFETDGTAFWREKGMIENGYIGAYFRKKSVIFGSFMIVEAI